MKTTFSKIGLLAFLGFVLVGCVHIPPYDYTNYRQHQPRSVLVLPPLNESTAVEGTYGYLSTVTYPLTELGYYVYPVAVVDQFLKENGMPTAGEMHQIPLNKINEIIGADAVLYLTVQQYGSKYQVINSATNVSAIAFFASHGPILWAVGLTMAVCNLAGAQLGTHLALRHGAGFIRKAFLLVVAVLIVKQLHDLL